MREGYLALLPVLIILALITLAVAFVLYFNTNLIRQVMNGSMRQVETTPLNTSKSEPQKGDTKSVYLAPKYLPNGLKLVTTSESALTDLNLKTYRQAYADSDQPDAIRSIFSFDQGLSPTSEDLKSLTERTGRRGGWVRIQLANAKNNEAYLIEDPDPKINNFAIMFISKNGIVCSLTSIGSVDKKELLKVAESIQ